jgi:hypothetical protein
MSTTAKQSKPSPWPPAALALPALAELERLSLPGGGPAVQGRLFPVVPDDGKAARLRRLRADVPGVVTANSLPLPPGLRYYLLVSPGDRTPGKMGKLPFDVMTKGKKP